LMSSSVLTIHLLKEGEKITRPAVGHCEGVVDSTGVFPGAP
jgi:hypothetical protein